ncbi:MAG: PilW family protein [Cellulosilyticaceae bacterium]
MNNKGITLVEIIVGIALASIVIAGASSVQIMTNKMLVERHITTDQRQIVEMIKDDMMTTLTYIEALELSNESRKLGTKEHSLSHEEGKGYTKDGEQVFGKTLYNGNSIKITFHPAKGNTIRCTIDVWETGGITLTDTFVIKLLNMDSQDIVFEEGMTEFKYVYYSDTQKPAKSMP